MSAPLNFFVQSWPGKTPSTFGPTSSTAPTLTLACEEDCAANMAATITKIEAEWRQHILLTAQLPPKRWQSGVTSRPPSSQISKIGGTICEAAHKAFPKIIPGRVGNLVPNVQATFLALTGRKLPAAMAVPKQTNR
jgi:hypothetical protein